jgi:ABC-2 type transport system ATP-binding protein
LTTVLSTQQLTKHFGPIKAVNQLNLNVEKGSVYGILGPNGSGKTTTLGMVLGVINSTSGNYRWFDKDNNDDNRKRIGALLEQPNFYPYLSGEENLKVVAKIKGVDEVHINKALSSVNLSERKKSEARTYSLGMKQRLALASALLGDPEVLVLDEPTNGLDPQGIAEVRDFIRREASGGRTILLASHILDEVEKVCTHVSVIKKGNLLAEGSVQNILSGENQIEISAADMEHLSSLLNNYSGVKKIEREKEFLLITADDAISAAHVNRYLVENGAEINHLTMRKKSLEQHFLELTS